MKMISNATTMASQIPNFHVSDFLFKGSAGDEVGSLGAPVREDPDEEVSVGLVAVAGLVGGGGRELLGVAGLGVAVETTPGNTLSGGVLAKIPDKNQKHSAVTMWSVGAALAGTAMFVVK
ncbi:MAG TPA: hypothetical protein VLJ59_00715 [Mycobacteriales bacterium]|nr:hypothetical protein [Mycobacteriales bacterium]